MGLFFGRKDRNEELPEDFVLYEADEDEDEYYLDEEDEYYSEDEDVYEEEDNLEDQDTRKIDVEEVEAMLDENDYDYEADEDEDEEVELTLFGRLIHNRVVAIVASCVVAAIVLGAAAYGIVSYLNPLRNYAQVLASKENVLRTMDVEGTLESGNRYNITSLVAGKIITSKYEVGDTVKAGDVIYKIDDTDAKLALERAKNELERASDPKVGNTGDSAARIVATEAGVIKSLSIKAGSSISAGSQIGTVLKSDGTVAPLISYVSGKVSVVSVNVGRTVSIGQVIASMGPKDTSDSEDKKYEKKSGEIDVQSAQRHLDNYSIKAPVEGVVAEKYYRVGDNVGITDADNPMMVIIDTSKLTFKFSVDEYKVREMKKGLEVVITTDSMPDETFLGEVSYVSTEGIADESGKPMYEVGVVIDEPGDLKAGMNIKAKVVLASAKKVVAVPEKALLKSDGQNALVLIKKDEFAENAEDMVDESLDNSLQNPEIKVPDGCALISVRYGISDGTIVEIISGVSVGDTIVYNPEAENNFVIATGDNKKDISESDVGKGVSGKESDYSVDGETTSDREKAEAAVRDKIKAAVGEDAFVMGTDGGMETSIN